MTSIIPTLNLGLQYGVDWIEDLVIELGIDNFF